MRKLGLVVVGTGTADKGDVLAPSRATRDKRQLEMSQMCNKEPTTSSEYSLPKKKDCRIRERLFLVLTHLGSSSYTLCMRSS